MKASRWITYPECQPDESGLYVVNWKINNVYMTVLSFFDRNTKRWYDSNDREKLIEGINAFNPFKVTHMFNFNVKTHEKEHPFSNSSNFYT